MYFFVSDEKCEPVSNFLRKKRHFYEKVPFDSDAFQFKNQTHR